MKKKENYHLESASHEGIMNSGFSEDGKMDVEESNVEYRRHDGDDGRLHNQLGHEGQRANGLVGQPTP